LRGCPSSCLLDTLSRPRLPVASDDRACPCNHGNAPCALFQPASLSLESLPRCCRRPPSPKAPLPASNMLVLQYAPAASEFHPQRRHLR